MIVNFSVEGYHIVCTVAHYLSLQCLGDATGVHRFASNFGWS